MPKAGLKTLPRASLRESNIRKPIMNEPKESTEKQSSEEESTYLDSNQTRKEGFELVETFTSHETAVTSAAEHAKALIQAKFIVAIKKPRKIEDFRVKNRIC
jgi:hypothetical protein